MKQIRAFRLEDDRLHLLDQRALPVEEKWLDLYSVESVAHAIETLAVRGAPAIGGAAACALVLAAEDTYADAGALYDALAIADARLRVTRPTAVNLFYALDRMAEKREALRESGATLGAFKDGIRSEATAIVREDERACTAMGEHGRDLFKDGDRVLTVCHTGSLATCGDGTALGVLKAAAMQGKKIHVFAMETRPLLQGARLTAWECMQVGLDVTLITDNMVGFALARQGITRAISGADRIAKNGDTANKIGTYTLATLCEVHGVPFHVAAPTTTFDTSLETGAGIPIEERDGDEVRRPRGAIFAPDGVNVWNPAFDVTPAARIDTIVSERGTWRPAERQHPW